MQNDDPDDTSVPVMSRLQTNKALLCACRGTALNLPAGTHVLYTVNQLPSTGGKRRLARNASPPCVCLCVQDTVDQAVEVLNSAKQELDFTKTGEDAEALREALREAAAAYKALHIKARGAGVPVPKDASILADAEVVWTKEDLIGARDWMRFEDAGWVVMDDLPEVPEIFDRTFFLAQDQGDPPDAIVPVSAPPCCVLGPAPLRCVWMRCGRVCGRTWICHTQHLHCGVGYAPGVWGR